MKKLTLRLDPDLHKRLKLLSVETEESLQDMAVRLLTEELKHAEVRRKGETRRRPGEGKR